MDSDVITAYGYAPADKDTGVVKPKGKSQIRAHEGVVTLDTTEKEEVHQSEGSLGAKEHEDEENPDAVEKEGLRGSQRRGEP